MTHPKPTKRLLKALSFARTLRIKQTSMEKFLWKKLRARRFHNVKFRRQVPIGPYIVDFYCAEKKLILEVDGGVHALQTSYDQKRDTYMRTNGYTVLRVSNRFVKEWLPEALENIGRLVGISYGE